MVRVLVRELNRASSGREKLGHTAGDTISSLRFILQLQDSDSVTIAIHH